MTFTHFVLISWMLSIGYMPFSDVTLNDETSGYKNAFIQEFYINFNIVDAVNIYTEIDVRELKSSSVYFAPHRADFIIGAEAYYKILKVGISHECNHDVIHGIGMNETHGFERGISGVYFDISPEIKINNFFNARSQARFGLDFTHSFNMRSKYNERAYFNFSAGNSFKENIFYSSFGIAFSMLKYLDAFISIKPEYYMTERAWEKLGIHTGLEAKYKNLGIGLDYIYQHPLSNTTYTINEIKIFVRFMGKTSLF